MTLSGMSIYRVDKKNFGYPDIHLFKNSFFEKLLRIEMKSEHWNPDSFVDYGILIFICIYKIPIKASLIIIIINIINDISIANINPIPVS